MKRLLIVVDMLNDFCDEAGTLAKSIITGEFYATPIIKPLYNKVLAYRNAKGPIIWLCDAHAKDDKEFDRFPPHAIKDTWGARIIDAMFPEGTKGNEGNEWTIQKTRYSGFYGTDLEYQLLRLAPDMVEVCGVCTSICVMDTVGGLANRDYDTVVPADCVADFSPEAHEVSLDRMAGLYGAEIA